MSVFGAFPVRIHSERGKIRKTPNTDIYHASGGSREILVIPWRAENINNALKMKKKILIADRENESANIGGFFQ